MVLVADIHHVSLNVADTDRALAFYVGVLGLTPLSRPDFPFGGAWLDVGNDRQLHLIEGDVPPDRGQHVAFWVADLSATIDALRRSGVDVSDARPIGDTALRQAFAHDPDGNRLEFTQTPG